MPRLEHPLGKASEWSHARTVHVEDQSYNLALAIWSLLEQNAASLKAEGASDAMVSVVQRDAVATILAEVCHATGGGAEESKSPPLATEDGPMNSLASIAVIRRLPLPFSSKRAPQRRPRVGIWESHHVLKPQNFRGNRRAFPS
jgi:hypothetical protein